MKHDCTFLVPFYNEEGRITRTLRELTKSQEVGKIVCVNDGSTDDGPRQVRKQFPDVTLIHKKTCTGKTRAIGTGVAEVKTKYTFLVDADLKKLDVDELDQAVRVMKTHRDIDMILMRRVDAILISRIFRFDALLTGERLLYTRDLKQILKKKMIGYQIEVGINEYFLDKKRTVYWMPLTAVNTLKYEKHGLIPGLRMLHSMFREVMQYGNRGTYMRQFLTLGRSLPQ